LIQLMLLEFFRMNVVVVASRSLEKREHSFCGS
jgi:hypothetical protein